MPNNNQWLTEILEDCLLDWQRDQEFTVKDREAQILQKISEIETEARIDEIDRLTDYINNRERYTSKTDAEKVYTEMRRMELALHQASLNKNGDSDVQDV